MGAVYGAAATLTITNVDDIGAATTAITTPGTVDDITYGLLATDTSIAENIQVAQGGTGNNDDQITVQIMSGDCTTGTVEYTITTTGAASDVNSGISTINLDSNSNFGALAPFTQASGSGLTSSGLPVSLIDCVKITITAPTP